MQQVYIPLLRCTAINTIHEVYIHLYAAKQVHGCTYICTASCGGAGAGAHLKSMDLNLRWARATNDACHLWQCQGEANDSTSEKHAEIWDYYTDEVLLILQNSET